MILMPLMMLKIGKINSLMKTCLNVYACDFELYCQGLLVSSVTNLAIFEELGAPGAALPIRALPPGRAVVGALRAGRQGAFGADAD